jgi:hypothetical protein
LVLKMPKLHGVISIRRDVNWASDCDRESCETAEASTELQDLKQALAKSPEPDHA